MITIVTDTTNMIEHDKYVLSNDGLLFKLSEQGAFDPSEFIHLRARVRKEREGNAVNVTIEFISHDREDPLFTFMVLPPRDERYPLEHKVEL